MEEPIENSTQPYSYRFQQISVHPQPYTNTTLTVYPLPKGLFYEPIIRPSSVHEMKQSSA